MTGRYRWWLAAALLSAAGCGAGRSVAREATVHTYPPPSSREQYCAWYGDARNGVLYFGQAAFWSAMRFHENDPTADLRAVGPVLIGRFDLLREQPLAPLEVGTASNRSGVWDVLAHPNGRIYFTTFYEAAGYIDPASSEWVRLDALGSGLNELALGPDGRVLISRYADASRADGVGAILVVDADGALQAEYPLRPPVGYQVAPKSIAYDPLRGEIWVTTDVFPTGTGPGGLRPANREIRHDAYVLDRRGAQVRRVTVPELQFAAFAENGAGFRAEVDGGGLWLRLTAPEEDPEGGRRILLDSGFAETLDFVQDIQLGPEGRAVVTRWSGWIHWVDAAGDVQTSRLPRIADGGLYYTAVLTGDRICATHCADVNVVCRDVP